MKEMKDADELFEDYKNQVESISGGLLDGNKADFIKMYAFFASIIYPVIHDYVEDLAECLIKK